MPKIIKSAVCVMLCVCALCGFSACKKENADIPSASYVYHPSDETVSATEETTGQATEKITLETSWRDNFTVKYSYFNNEQEKTAINVCEKRSEHCFSAEDTDSGDMLYYRADGTDIDSYVIVPHEKEQVHSVIKGKTLSDLSSTFMKLSEVDENLPTLANVLFMYNESVAGRDCAKYIQRAYSGGELTKTVYVWIDSQYGFAAKGEVYDGDTKLIASWEISEFSSGGVADEDVEIDLSAYKIVEE